MLSLLLVETGYHHINSAWAYRDGEIEKGVGEAIGTSGIPKREIFVVTKLSVFSQQGDRQHGL